MLRLSRHVAQGDDDHHGKCGHAGDPTCRRCAGGGGSQTEIVTAGGSHQHAQHGHGGVRIALSGQNQLAERAAAQKDGAEADSGQTQEVPETVRVGHWLISQGEMEVSKRRVTDQSHHKNGQKTRE